MKNLLFIIHKLSNGGAEKAIVTLAHSLKKEYNVTIVVFDNSLKEYVPEVNIIDLKLSPGKNIFERIYTLIQKVNRIKKIKKELNIDCSISFLVGGNLVNCLSRNSEKVIISVRNMQSKLNHNYFQKLSNKIAFKKADKIVTVSDAVKNDIKKYYNVDDSKVVTIKNMLDIEAIEKLKEEKIEDKEWNKNIIDEFRIITIGRLIHQKGQWHMIKALKRVVKEIPNVKLYILGRGELKPDYEKLIEKLELQNNVYLMDFKTNPYKYLENSDLFVLTSLYEGMPNVILEAMACNLPIIATDCEGGTREILEDNKEKYGVLIPKLDEKYDFTENISEEENKLAETIIGLLKDKDKKSFYIEKSKERINDFKNTKVNKEWINIIENK